jgi:hypothetical protein
MISTHSRFIAPADGHQGNNRTHEKKKSGPLKWPFFGARIPKNPPCKHNIRCRSTRSSVVKSHSNHSIGLWQIAVGENQIGTCRKITSVRYPDVRSIPEYDCLPVRFEHGDQLQGALFAFFKANNAVHQIDGPFRRADNHEINNRRKRRY